MESILKKDETPELDRFLSLIKGFDHKAQLRLIHDFGYAEGIETVKKEKEEKPA